MPEDVMPALPPLERPFAFPRGFEGLPEAERQRLEELQNKMRSWHDQRSWGPFSGPREEIWKNRYDTWDREWAREAIVPMVAKLIVAVLAIGAGLRLVRGRKDGSSHTPSPPSVA
jgi:hypothetical protein